MLSGLTPLRLLFSSLFVVAIGSGVSLAATTLIRDFEFNIDGRYPSADYPDTIFVTNTNPAASEHNVYHIQNGLLQQRTLDRDLPSAGWADYVYPNITNTGGSFEFAKGYTMEARLRIPEIEAVPQSGYTGFWGAYFGFYDGNYGYQVLFDGNGALTGTASEGFPNGIAYIPVPDLSAFHTYRITKPPSSNQYEIYIDGEPKFLGLAGAGSHNGYGWGDGRSLPNNGASVDWDYVRIYEGDPPPFEPPPPLPPPPLPTLPVADPAPHVKNLVVVVHGWAGAEASDGRTQAWVNDMASAIEDQIAIRADKDDWAVVPYDWTESSGRDFDNNTGPPPIGPILAYVNAAMRGAIEGVEWGKQGYEHVHLIGHSAAAGFLDSASEMIKTNPSSEHTTVQLTLLDGFVPVPQERYGTAATWIDNYFVRNDYALNFDIPLTDVVLDLGHNVDLTYLSSDPDHFDPVDFYRKSIDGQTFFETIGSQHPGEFREIDPLELWPAAVEGSSLTYGFDLSMERGNWQPDLSPDLQHTLRVGNDPPVAFDPFQLFFRKFVGRNVDSTLVDSAVSNTGQGSVLQDQMLVTTGSPVWASAVYMVDHEVNMVSFDLEFLSNASGVLGVFFDSQLIGIFEEQYFTDRAEINLPLITASSGFHNLAIRLEPFDGPPSSVRLSNIAFTKWSVVPEPSTLVLITLAIFLGASHFSPKREWRHFHSDPAEYKRRDEADHYRHHA